MNEAFSTAARAPASTPAARLAELIALAEADAGSNARKSGDYALEAADLAQALGDRPAFARALFLAGRCADYLLDQETALNRYRDALAEYEAINDTTAQAKTLRAIGFVYDSLGDFPQAIDYELKALALDEATGNPTGRAASLRTIGVIYSKSGDLKTGLDYHKQSLALAEQGGDATEIGKALNNVGITLKSLGRPEEALAAQLRALDMFRASGATMHESAVLNNLGLTQARLGQAEAAEQTLRDALVLSERSGYRLGVVNAMRSLGRLYTGQRRFGEAGRLLADALDVAEAHRLKPDQAECHQALSEYFEHTGDFASALKHYRRYHQLERDVLNDTTSKQLKALQIRHQVAAAQRDAEIHRLRNIELARAYADLEAANSSLKEVDAQKTRLLAQLERQTFEDALTGLANRRFLDQRLAEEFERARRHRRPLAVAIADLDHFKRVNDTYSHAVGDDVLRAIAHILRDQVRHTDLVARFGGEEFVLVLTETDLDAARLVCEKLRAAVEAYQWSALRPGLAVTISIGVSADTDVASHERMLATADERLYEAKAAGRNRVIA
jgi:diguanylate cyclase (GGDEF)-like protein